MTERVKTLMEKNDPKDPLFLELLYMMRGTFTVDENMKLEIEPFTKEEAEDLRNWIKESKLK